MKKKLFLLSALLFITKEEILANPIEWQTVSPMNFGVSVEKNGEIIHLGNNYIDDFQLRGVYGAGFYTREGGYLDVNIDYLIFSPWSWINGYYDQFLVTTSPENFFWENRHSQETIFQFRESPGMYYAYEGFDDFFQTYLNPGTFFSFVLETKSDDCFSSFEYGNFVFIFDENPASCASPIPEPATTLLFGTGLIALTGISRKRKDSPNQFK